jgi:hypothetical protein
MGRQGLSIFVRRETPIRDTGLHEMNPHFNTGRIAILEIVTQTGDNT